MSQDYFESSRIRLTRAKELIGDFKTQAETFLKSRPFEGVSEVNQEKTHQEFKVRFTQPLPTRLTSLAVDAIENLRASLDNVLFSVTRAAGNTSAHPHAHFPFCSELGKFENTIKGRCKDLHGDIVSLSRHYRPYGGGDDVLRDNCLRQRK